MILTKINKNKLSFLKQRLFFYCKALIKRVLLKQINRGEIKPEATELFRTESLESGTFFRNTARSTV